MPATVVLGTQWGDEGKGKAVDYLADRMDFVVRYQGGNNAGHTIIAEGRLLKLNLVPSGVLYPHITNVIADGVVVDPAVLLRELDELTASGVDVSGLQLSLNAHLIMPYHLELEKVTQRFLGTNALGHDQARDRPRLRRPRGPRRYPRPGPLRREDPAREARRGPLGEEPDPDEGLQPARRSRRSRSSRTTSGTPSGCAATWPTPGACCTTGSMAGKHVMLEGAQGTMLDLDHGTYPFVTSSTPVTGYALASAGFGPQHVERVIGITKAYVTRVGSGPFPTEALDADGERMGERGAEFGTTTGRKRRCGWFDGCVLRYAARLNGLTDVILTKLDVLSGFETLRVCVGYRAGGETWDDVPPNQTLFHEAEPVWEELPGWADELGDVRSFDDLPKEAQSYVQHPRGAGRRAGLDRRRRPGARAEPRGALVKVLVVGGGGREHALCWRLAQDPTVTRVLAAPGNAGIAAIAECFPEVAADDVDAVVNLVDQQDVDLTVVGPEAPLVAGLADALREARPARLRAVAAAARIEGSKAFAKDVMARRGVPDRARRRVRGRREGGRLRRRARGQAVVKADGLAAGKGVTVAPDRDDGRRRDRGVPRRGSLRRRRARRSSSRSCSKGPR